MQDFILYTGIPVFSMSIGWPLTWRVKQKNIKQQQSLMNFMQQLTVVLSTQLAKMLF